MSYILELLGSRVTEEVSVEILHSLPWQRLCQLHLPLRFVRAVRYDLPRGIKHVQIADRNPEQLESQRGPFIAAHVGHNSRQMTAR